MKNICFQMSRRVWLAILMVVALTCPALAQNITVTGTVYEPDGETAIGVSITQKGNPGVGVTTGIDGDYRIQVPADAVLVVSYVGYETQEVPVDGRTNIDITLSTQSKALEELVVIGYGVVKKGDATGSVAVVKPDEIEAGLATNVQDLLVGATPGVVVTTTGNPSDGGTIRIRGGSSLNASNDPLIVIDGVPMDGKTVVGASNPLALVSPENIESMTILKDASATAIFGSRASNGVIIITTKKGQSGKPQINFAANVYVNTPRNYMPMMDGDQYRSFILNEYGQGSVPALALGTANTDWQKEILSTTVSSDYNLSIGGSVGFLPYRVALSYTNNKGIMRETSMDRVNASINLTPKFFNDHLSINANLKGAYVKNNYQGSGKLGGAISFNPTLPIYNPEGNIFNNWTTYTSAGQLAGPTTQGGQLNTLAAKNPVAALRDGVSDGKSYQSVGNIQFDFKIPNFEDLRANLNLGYDYSHGEWGGHDNPFSPNVWGGTHYVRDPHAPAGAGLYDMDYAKMVKDGYGTHGHQFGENYTLLLDFYLNYNKEIESIKSSIDVTAGYSWQKFKTEGHSYNTVWAPLSTADTLVKAYNLGGIQLPYGFDASTLAGAQEYIKYINDYQSHATSYSSAPYQLVSFFARVNYWLADKYGVTATVRRDGTSRFSPDTRWGTFPSVALSWRIDQEDFMAGARSWLNDLKLRATWGITGQQDLGGDYFPYLPIYSNWTSTSQTAINPVTGAHGIKLTTPNPYNAALKWEETTTWNIGIDFGILNNRINGNLELYKRKTKDLLTYANYPAGSNLSNMGNINLGDMENTGIEFNITARPIVNKDFTWTTTFNIGANKNKITRLADGASSTTGSIGTAGDVQKHEVGFPAFSFYVYEQVYNPDGTPMEGVYVDRNGDGEITESDKYLYHSRDPKVTMTLGNTFNYKNWDFGISLRSSIGNWVYNKNECDNSFKLPGTANPPLSNIMTADHYLWSMTKNTQVQLSDYWVQNASFVRCDNITVGYTWPNVLQKMRLRLYGAVQNPFVISKYRGLDPEVFSGIDSSVYPKPITVSAGVVVTF